MFINAPFFKAAGRRNDGALGQAGWAKLTEGKAEGRIFKDIHVGNATDGQEGISAGKNAVV